MNRRAGMLSELCSQIWAIRPETLQAMVAAVRLETMSGALDGLPAAAAAEIVAARAARASSASAGAVAVLPLYGMISRVGGALDWLFGASGTATVKLTQQFRQALADPNVQAIVFDVDSPGGTVEGVDELASEIRAARGRKKMIAVASGMCASAAYYIASACDEMVVSPSSTTGSIGVYCAHEDASKLLENMGVKVSLIKFGENKAGGNPYEPLSDQARANMQESVDLHGNMFEKAVAKGRKITQAKVHSTFGQGLVFGAAKAVEIGMADTIGTLDSVLARFGVTLGVSNTTSMQSRSDAVTAARPVADDATCQCACGPCGDGDCASCTTEDCDFDGCECEAAQKNAGAKVKRAARARSLRIAAA